MKLTRIFLYNKSSFPANCTFAITDSLSLEFKAQFVEFVVGEAVADA
jgi:hypothetical protein